MIKPSQRWCDILEQTIDWDNDPIPVFNPIPAFDPNKTDSYFK